MSKWMDWARNGLALLGILALGVWLGGVRTATAATHGSEQAVGNLQFQLAGVDNKSALLVHEPESRTVYIYQGATMGNSYLQCNFKFLMSHPGVAIQRVNCDVPRTGP